ncbi:MAG TPA: shikimate dehydrogenase [Chiayiivirga sp.]|nr:shikimate dehydrogenase [Chiayiivirga sp.]
MPQHRSCTQFAVFGQPVAHSLSPRIHRHFGAACGIEVNYEAIEVAPEQFAARLAAFHAAGAAGANVTLPHKEQAARLCRELSPQARLSGAVNTVIRRDDGWAGDNTDGLGLCRDLRANLGVELSGRRVLLLGAGGAARGIVPALFDEGVAELVVANRSPERALALAFDLDACGPIDACALEALDGAGRFSLLINATSAARAGAQLHLPTSLIAPDAVAYDLSYGAAAVPFLQWAITAGIERRADGLGMLVEQAAEAFQRWHGVRPETDAVLAQLRAGQSEFAAR